MLRKPKEVKKVSKKKVVLPTLAKVKSNGVFYVVISLIAVFGMVGIVGANQSFKQILADALAPIVAPFVVDSLGLGEESVEPDLGAFPGGDIFVDVRVHQRLDYEISEDGFTKRIPLPTASSSIDFAGLNTAQKMTDRFLVNDWGDSICQVPELFVDTSSGGLAFHVQVGTSTPTTTDATHTTSTGTLLGNFLLATDTVNRIYSTRDYWGTNWQEIKLDPANQAMAVIDRANHYALSIDNTTTTDPVSWMWLEGDAVNILASTTDYDSATLNASSTNFKELLGFVDIDCRLITTLTNSFSR